MKKISKPRTGTKILLGTIVLFGFVVSLIFMAIPFFGNLLLGKPRPWILSLVGLILGFITYKGSIAYKQTLGFSLKIYGDQIWRLRNGAELLIDASTVDDVMFYENSLILRLKDGEILNVSREFEDFQEIKEILSSKLNKK